MDGIGGFWDRSQLSPSRKIVEMQCSPIWMVDPNATNAEVIAFEGRIEKRFIGGRYLGYFERFEGLIYRAYSRNSSLSFSFLLSSKTCFSMVLHFLSY